MVSTWGVARRTLFAEVELPKESCEMQRTFLFSDLTRIYSLDTG